MTRLFSLLFIKYDSKFRFNDIDEELVEDLDNRLTAIYNLNTVPVIGDYIDTYITFKNYEIPKHRYFIVNKRTLQLIYSNTDDENYCWYVDIKPIN